MLRNDVTHESSLYVDINNTYRNTATGPVRVVENNEINNE